MATMYCNCENPPKHFAPSSIFIKAPLTPPPTDSKPTKLVLQLLRHIRQRQAVVQVLESEWHEIGLTHGEYNVLVTLLEKEKPHWAFVESKIRYI